MRANVSIIKTSKIDTLGNVIFKYNSISFNPRVAMAWDIVIMEVEHLVKPGEIPPDRVQLPEDTDVILHGENGFAGQDKELHFPEYKDEETCMKWFNSHGGEADHLSGEDTAI